MLHLISSFFHTRSLLITYSYVSMESIDCILLPLLALISISLSSSVSIFCFSRQNLCCNLNFNLLFYMSSWWFCLSFSTSILYFFLLFYFIFKVKFHLNNAYNLQIKVFFLRHTFLSRLPFYLYHCHLLNNYTSLV